MTSSLEHLEKALLDRYVIEREIGAGGMATVYLAADVRHDRKVAVKVLRPWLASVIGVDRFLREIKITARLQHPHILPLHDSGSVEGTVFYVMPFVAGESLRQRLDRERELPVMEAVRIASEVASALDYANREGILHRDIKPENILLHDGQVLVADFGVALALSAVSGDRMTESGITLGTPQYMSPEQALGDRALDGRTDVYALGCVLYEMLVGHPPFTGSSVQAIAAKAATEKPAQIHRYRDTVPRHVEAAVLSALAPLPADRFATAGAFAAALAGAGSVAPPRSQSDVRWKWATAALAIALAGTSVLTAWNLIQRRRETNTALLRYAIALPNDQTLVPGLAPRFAISRDGSKFVYTGPGEGGSQLWLRDRDQLRAIPIPGTQGAAQPVFSPDGKQVAFITFAPTTAVNVATLGGGPPLRVATVAGSTIESGGIAWGSDGYLYATGHEGLVRVKSTGGTLEPVTVVDSTRGETNHLWPDVLPNAKSVLFTIRHANGPFEIGVANLSGGPHRVLTRGYSARYAPSGHIVYLDNRVLLAAPLDPARAQLTGTATPLVETVSGHGASDLAISQSGTLLYASGQSSADVRGPSEIVRVTRGGRADFIDPSWPAAGFADPALSPDGQRLAVTINDGGHSSIWIKQLNRGSLSRLSFGQDDIRPEWTSDGRALTFISRRSGEPAIWFQRADGAGAESLLRTDRKGIVEAFSTADGRWIVYRTNLQSPGRADILAVKRGADSTPLPLVATEYEEVQPTVSPDGRWLAYVSNETGRPEVFIRPFPNASPTKWQVSMQGGSSPAWAHSGRELFYVSSANTMVAADVRMTPAFEIGPQRPLFNVAPFSTGNLHRQYAVLPDDQSFVMIRPTVEAGRGELVAVENWFAELRRTMAK